MSPAPAIAPTPAPAPAPEFLLLLIDGDAPFANNIAGVRVPAATSAAHGADDTS